MYTALAIYANKRIFGLQSKQTGNKMKQYDILISINKELLWVEGIFTDTIDKAIMLAMMENRGSRYVGHKAFIAVNGEWMECSK